MVDHANNRLGPDRDVDPAAGRFGANGVFDQVAQGVVQQARVAANQERERDCLRLGRGSAPRGFI
jgi:hypothetical protein